MSYDDDFDDEEDEETALVPCPSCGEEIYEDAERCPECGEWITHSRSAWKGKPLVWVVLGLLGILAVIYTSVGWWP